MLKLRVALCIFIFLASLLRTHAQKTKLIQIRYDNSERIKESYSVMKKKRFTKHGIFTSYHKSGTVKMQGNYANGKKDGTWSLYDEYGHLKKKSEWKYGKLISSKKVGRWLELHENGQVITGFDYTKNEPIKTTIRPRLEYPMSARENNIQGVVRVNLKLNANCEVEEIRLLNTLHPDCDLVAINGIKKFARLMKKYKSEACNSFDEEIPVEFSLE